MTNHDQTHSPLCILHLEDSPHDHVLVKREFQKSEVAVDIYRVENLLDFEKAINDKRFNVILADYRLPGFTALDAWALMQDRGVRLPFVLLSGAIGETAAVAAIKAGISDYLPKDDLSKLRHVTQRAIEMNRILLAKELADIELAQSEKRLADFAEHLQVTIERERASIAREIHDDIGGSLAAIRFDLSWIERHTTDAATRSHANAATDMLQHAVQASQRIMMNLRPAILDQGLIAAIQWLGGNFSKRTGIETLVRVPMQLEHLPKTVQLVAYRTAQEALTNIGKHAQCKLVKIDLSDERDVLTLEVSDDGQGLSDIDLSKPDSFGIRGLKERAKAIGGWLDVSSQRGRGTSIILSVPAMNDAPSTQENHQNDSGNFV
jgi:signal transduction histidine kinase